MRWVFAYKCFTTTIRSDNIAIYLDGNGTPWLRGRHPAFDPTPRNPLTLQLMLQDTRIAVYIGRPCYFELGPTVRCINQLWTSAGYSEDVVIAIDSAIGQTLKLFRPKNVQLIGFSGGGALAMLIANRRDDIDSVITVAGNLDTDLWVRHYSYLPLKGSLNPALAASLNIPILHSSGDRDLAVPPKITNSYLNSHSGYYWPMPEFDHNCC